MKHLKNVQYSSHIQMLNRIRGYIRGRILFPADFKDLASVTAINKTLSRLTKQGILRRLGQGVYQYNPKVDVELGVLNPSLEDIAEAIARRDKVTIIPTGVFALQKLGLSTQVTMKAVYLTDGAPRKIKVGKRTITFKKTSPKRLMIKGKINQLVIQALSEMKIKNIDNKIIDKIHKALVNENPDLIRKDAMLAPAWIAKIMNDYLKKINHEKLD